MHEVASGPIENEILDLILLDSKYLKTEALQMRDYQVEIAKKCIGNNYLVSIPTGLGKTIIAILLTAQYLHSHHEGKIVMVAPTKPLIIQHADSFKQFLKVHIDDKSVLTGSIPGQKRTELFRERRILFFTPQTLRNDLEKKRYGIEQVSLLIVDEAHKASGNYAYAQIADFYHEMNPNGNILALTASPGSTQEKIKTLCDNLYIPTDHIALRTREDEDVKDFVKEMNIEEISVDKSAFMEEILPELRNILKERLIFLMECGYLEDYMGNPIDDIEQLNRFSQYLSLQLNKKLLARIQEMKGSVILPGTQDENLYQAVSVNAEVLRIYHMIKTTEAQGLNVLYEYLDQMMQDAKKPSATKALKNLTADSRVYLLYKTIKQKAESEDKDDLLHPKLVKLQQIIREELENNPDARILLFAEFRDTITLIHKTLKLLPDVYPVRFVGQKTKSKKDKGMSQKTQIKTLEQFKEGKYNVLVSTSVAEEGLDIAECDVVIFYDAVPTEIRLIQRKGRTARQREGKVIILYCKDSSDEKNLKNSVSRLRKMQRNIKKTSIQLVHTPKETSQSTEMPNSQQKSINRFMEACENARKKTPEVPKFCILPKMPDNYPLPKLLGENGLAWEKCTTKSTSTYFPPHLTFESKIYLTILNPSRLQIAHASFDEFWTELKQISQAYCKVLIIMDFIEYIELVQGKKRKLLEELTEIASDFPNVLVLPIDSVNDLQYIVIPMIKKQMDE